MSLVVLAISLILSNLETIREFIDGKQAKIIGGISDPNTEGIVEVSFTNYGEAPARIEYLVCEWASEGYTLGVQLRSDESILVDIGNSAKAKFTAFNRYVRSWNDELGEDGFGQDHTPLELAPLFATPANACCGETTAKCQITFNDGNDEDRSTSLFWTTKMKGFYERMERDLKKAKEGMSAEDWSSTGMPEIDHWHIDK
jgi:hypothetical protein